MARDDYRVARAGVYGAAGTACMSAAISLMTAKPDPSPLVWSLAILALGFFVAAYFFWSAGFNPKPPKYTISVKDSMNLVDRFFPEMRDFEEFETGFLEDARYGRQRLWGRLREPDDFESILGKTRRYPRVYIQPDYWNTADIDWLDNKTMPLTGGQVYIDLCLGETSLRWNLLKDKVARRYRG